MIMCIIQNGYRSLECVHMVNVRMMVYYAHVCWQTWNEHVEHEFVVHTTANVSI